MNRFSFFSFFFFRSILYLWMFFTNLHFYSQNKNRLDYCSFLMARGVDPRLKASDGRTPIDLAHENGFVDCTDCLNGVKGNSPFSSSFFKFIYCDFFFYRKIRGKG